ncbi:MAG: histidine kinase [Pseudomonadota bacterium]
MNLNHHIERPLSTFLAVTVFSFGIAVLVWAVGGGHFLGNLVVSLSIGCSISLSFIFLSKPMLKVMSPYLAPIPITAIGLVAGLILGGSLVLGRPWFFFSEDYGTLLVGVFFGVIGFAIFGTRARLRETAAQLAHARLKTAKQEKMLAETELKLLQAQIEPHFLFNTLSNVASLIHKNPHAAESTLVNLTTLLRASLSRTRQGETTFGQELDMAKAYLEINAIRMQDRLSFHIDVPDLLKSTPLPPLLVQPLIENAIKHGIDPLVDGGDIWLRAFNQDNTLVIEVEDNGQGVSLQRNTNTQGTGTGLKNVRERLQALYGHEAKLTLTEPATGSGVLATLSIPRQN